MEEVFWRALTFGRDDARYWYHFSAILTFFAEIWQRWVSLGHLECVPGYIEASQRLKVALVQWASQDPQ